MRRIARGLWASCSNIEDISDLGGMNSRRGLKEICLEWFFASVCAPGDGRCFSVFSTLALALTELWTPRGIKNSTAREISNRMSPGRFRKRELIEMPCGFIRTAMRIVQPGRARLSSARRRVGYGVLRCAEGTRALAAFTRHVFLFLGVFTLWVCAPCAQRTEPSTGTNNLLNSQPLSLADAVNLALKQNPAILRAQKDLEAARGVVIQTRAVVIPKVRAMSRLADNVPLLTR